MVDQGNGILLDFLMKSNMNLVRNFTKILNTHERSDIMYLKQLIKNNKLFVEEGGYYDRNKKHF